MARGFRIDDFLSGIEEFSRMSNALRQAIEIAPTLIPHRMLAEFEPEIVDFRGRIGKVSSMTRRLRSLPHDGLSSFPKTSRMEFLWSARNYLEHLEHEELIVAFGVRRGRPLDSGIAVTRVWKGVGSRNSSELTDRAHEEIERTLFRTDRGAVLVVHNHPCTDAKHALDEVFGWRPLPSSTDRDLATDFAQRVAAARAAGRADGSVLFYLVDEGRMLQFSLPSLERFAAAAQARESGTP